MSQTWGRAKDPDEIVDYGVDWSKDIGAATIDTSSWIIVKGSVTSLGDSHTGATTTVRISGGVTGEPTALTNRVVLSNGEQLEQTCILKIKDR